MFNDLENNPVHRHSTVHTVCIISARNALSPVSSVAVVYSTSIRDGRESLREWGFQTGWGMGMKFKMDWEREWE